MFGIGLRAFGNSEHDGLVKLQIVLLGSVSLAISGALLFSFLDITTINIYSQVGLITLVGLIAKNGILIVQFANTQQALGLSRTAAVREAALTRLRPSERIESTLGMAQCFRLRAVVGLTNASRQFADASQFQLRPCTMGRLPHHHSEFTADSCCIRHYINFH